MVFAALFTIGFVFIARFLPPLSPNDTAAQTVAIYQDRTNSIRTGLAVCYIGTMFLLAFGAGIVGQTRRIKGVSHAVTYFQLSSFAASILLIIIPIVCWWIAAFRPETRSAESIQLINDLGWMMFVVGFAPFVAWFASTGLAILSDTSELPLYPRWSGYLSLFMAFVMVPPVMLIFVKTGPLAWNGLISWWIPLTDFFAWFVVITVLTVKAINRKDYERTPVSSRMDAGALRLDAPSVP
jgi:hypothetical protein